MTVVEKNGLPLRQVIQGDCLEVMKMLPDRCVDVAVVDWPYNVGIAGWDKIEAYSDFLGDFIVQLVRVLKVNASVWAFHMHFEPLAHIHYFIETHTALKHRQLIVLDKGRQSIAGRSSRNLRTLPKATEYLQLYAFEDPTGAERLSEEYAAVNPMSKYLVSEFTRAGVTNREISKLFPSKTGGLTGCVSNWTIGNSFPSKRQYLKIREYLNRWSGAEYLRREYEDLRREYEDLRREYEDLRRTFNLPYGLTDVWHFNSYDVPNGHPAAKPHEIIARIVRIASNEGDIILDPFLGSGTTAVACEKLRRKWIGIEINPEYCEIARKRLEPWMNQTRLTPSLSSVDSSSSSEESGD